MISERASPHAVPIDWLDCSTLELLGAERDFFERYDLGAFIYAEDPSDQLIERRRDFFDMLDGFVSGAARMRQAAGSRVAGLCNMLATELALDKAFDAHCRAFEREKHDWPSLYETGAKSILYAYCLDRKGR